MPEWLFALLVIFLDLVLLACGWAALRAIIALRRRD